MLSQDELFAAWADGDARAGEAFIRGMFGPLHRFFASKVGSEVEELVQQTLTRLIEGRSRYSGRSSVRAYVYGVARNVLREHYRARTKAPLDVDEHSVSDMGAGPSTLRWRKAEDALLLESLRALPLKMQVILELYFWDELTVREIAEALEIPEGTVASRIRRAKRRIRERFESMPGAKNHAPETASLELDAWSERLRKSVPLPVR